MSDQSKQNISQLMDGELEKDCSRFLLKRMQSDPELSEKWDNYHLLRSYLQQEQSAPLMHDLGAKVTAQLAKESVDVTAESDHTERRPWYKPLLGTAIAASVAVVAVLGLGNPSATLESDANDNQAVFKTAAQLVNPPNASQVRSEQLPSYTRYPSLTPRVQQYIIESNGKSYVEVLPLYYNNEYMIQLEKQKQLKKAAAVAE